MQHRERTKEAAFPRPGFNDDVTSEHWNEPQAGMSLRDYFAGQALVGLLSGDSVYGDDERTFERMAAEEAYKIADTMLMVKKEAARMKAA